jgi:uncharacterized protein YjbI with pentapeptide repeats
MVILILIAGVALVAGLVLWLPHWGDRTQRASLGQSLLTGAVVTTALLLVQIDIDEQSRKAQEGADKRDRQRVLRLTAELGDDLSGITLPDMDLRGFRLQGKRMREADLRRSNLHASNLTRGDLRNARLQGAKLARARLTEAILDGAQLDRARLSMAELEQATLRFTRLRKARLFRARAVNARMEASDLTRAVLRRSVLVGADLTSATLVGADLRGADLVDADLRDADLHGADLRGAKLTGANLDGAAGSKDARYTDVRGQPVKFDKETEWPRGFSIKQLKVKAGEPLRRQLRFELKARRGYPLYCLEDEICMSFDGGVPRKASLSAVVTQPDDGADCRTGRWRGTWRTIEHKTDAWAKIWRAVGELSETRVMMVCRPTRGSGWSF